jgi:hypothetical protein
MVLLDIAESSNAAARTAAEAGPSDDSNQVAQQPQANSLYNRQEAGVYIRCSC